MSPKVRALLFDIQHAAIGIQAFVADRAEAELTTDLLLRSAVERQFEIIGEAMTRLRTVSLQTAEQISDYRQIIGFRNVLIHGYDTIKPHLIWETIQLNLPTLVREVEALMRTL